MGISLTLTGALVGDGEGVRPPPAGLLPQPADVAVGAAVGGAHGAAPPPRPAAAPLLAPGGADALGGAVAHHALPVRAAVHVLARVWTITRETGNVDYEKNETGTS